MLREGTVRYQTGALPTDYTYTGQRSMTDAFGLMYYRARWYDPALGRFAQADTLIPGAGNPMAWDRYAYTLDNPLRYSDPSGHLICSDKHVAAGDCSDEGAGLWRFNVTFSYNPNYADWSAKNKEAVRQAVVAVAIAMSKEIGADLVTAFNSVFDRDIEFRWDPDCSSCGNFAETKGPQKIVFAGVYKSGGNRTEEMAFLSSRNLVVHELGHAFALLWQGDTYDQSGPYGNQKPIPSDYLNNEGFYPSPGSASNTWRQHPCTSTDCTQKEVFADMFLGWTFGKWANDPGRVGDWRTNYMTTNMAEWVPAATQR